MSIYNVINSLLFKKTIDRSAIEELHVPFMFIKWLSFYDPATVELANEFNRIDHQITGKQLSYDFFHTVLPKLRYKKITYIKKPKKATKKKAEQVREEHIKLLAKSYEISEREVQIYFDLLDRLD